MVRQEDCLRSAPGHGSRTALMTPQLSNTVDMLLSRQPLQGTLPYRDFSPVKWVTQRIKLFLPSKGFSDFWLSSLQCFQQFLAMSCRGSLTAVFVGHRCLVEVPYFISTADLMVHCLYFINPYGSDNLKTVTGTRSGNGEQMLLRLPAASNCSLVQSSYAGVGQDGMLCHKYTYSV